MKEKERYKYILTILITLIVGVLGTLYTIKYLGLFDEKIIEKTVNTISIQESDTISSSIDKVYNSQVYIESFKNNNSIASGSGSGFVYKVNDNYGYVLTNYHVIEDASKVEITNMEGKTVTATILGGDVYSDVAVLRIEKDAVMLVAELGSSEDANVGDTIFAVGSPMGKTYIGSVTKGIISGKDRSVTTNIGTANQYVMEVLQVDAALNPGNSGGALVNINGEVIGITSMKLVENEVEGMGFAIPINLVKTMLDNLENGKDVERPVLGVSMLDVDNKYVLYTNGIILDSSINSGVVIVEVQEGSSADKAGLKKSDVVLEIDNNKITNIAYFRTALYKHKIGDTITLKVYRDNNIIDVKVKLDTALKNE